MTWRSTWDFANSDPERYWRTQSERVRWSKPPTRIMTPDEDGRVRWFADGELNTSALCLDVHIEDGRGDQLALVWDSPVTDSKETYTYRELRDAVARTAGGLRDLGVEKGDRVILYMPMVPEAVIAMLACARLGAVHSVVFGGFAPNELALRIDDAEPKVLLTATCGIEISRVIPYVPLVQAALEQAGSPPSQVVLLQREQHAEELPEGWQDWSVLAGGAPADPVDVRSGDPLYILYTSGTTAKPKGVVRDNGGHAVALLTSMEQVYGVGPGDVYWAGSDIGWVVGHSYIVYAPLLLGATTVMYEGKPVRTPDAGAFWRVIEEYGVNVLFTAPTAFRAVRKEDPEGELLRQYDISSLRTLFLAGERLDPPTLAWLEGLLPVPIVDHWWQTETGWPMVGRPMGIEAMPGKSGSAGVPIPGWNVQVLREDATLADPDERGAIVVKLPLPPGALVTLWRNEPRFRAAYTDPWPGYYHTADGGFIDQDGYVTILGRTDDVINVAGHRLSTGEMEAVVGGHAAIAECAVFGIADELKGQIPLGLVVLKDGQDVPEDTLEHELVQRVRHEIGPIACFRRAVVVDRLPKTRSGKILRRTLRELAETGQAAVPPTIDDPAILAEVRDALVRRGALEA